MRVPTSRVQHAGPGVPARATRRCTLIVTLIFFSSFQGTLLAENLSICGVNWTSAGDLRIGLSTLPGGAVGVADMITSPPAAGDTGTGYRQLQILQQAALSAVEVSISISGGVDYGYAGSVNDADISDGRGRSFDADAYCDQRKTKYAGSVTIEEFTPTQLRGSFSAELYSQGGSCLQPVGTVSGNFECGHPIRFDKRSLLPAQEADVARTLGQALWFSKLGRVWTGMPSLPGIGGQLPGGSGLPGQGGEGADLKECACSCDALATYPDDHPCSCTTAQASTGVNHPCREACAMCNPTNASFDSTSAGTSESPSTPGNLDEMASRYEDAAGAGRIPPEVAEMLRQSIKDMSPEDRAAIEQVMKQARENEDGEEQ